MTMPLSRAFAIALGYERPLYPSPHDTADDDSLDDSPTAEERREAEEGDRLDRFESDTPNAGR